MQQLKAGLQESQYTFPYHHIPHFTLMGGVSSVRRVWWGVCYLCLLQHVVELVRTLAPRSVLDVGCGDGRLLGLIEPQVEQVVGVDLSKRAIQFARAFYPQIPFIEGEASSLSEQFDLVTAIEVLEHIPDDQCSGFIKNLEERLTSGGHLIITVPSVRLPLEKKHYRHYDPKLLIAQIQSATDRLEVVQMQDIIRYTPALRATLFLLNNPIWMVELAPLQRLFWEVAWRGLRRASPGRGQHLLAVCRKV